MNKTVIRDFMLPNPYTIEFLEHLGTAEKIMNRYRIRHLPVVDGRKIYGLISERDLKIAAGVYKDSDFRTKILCKDICLSAPYVVEENEPLEAVLATMARRRLGSTVITKNGAVTGIFTTTDACRLLADLVKNGKASL